MQNKCFVPVTGRRRPFWATQIDCGFYNECNVECSIPGLRLKYETDCEKCEYCGDDCPNKLNRATIDTSDWVRGLALNILFTNGRRQDQTCGFRPGTRGGHWSDSYRGDNNTAGTLMRDIPVGLSITEAANLIKTYAKDSLQKLVLYGVAQSVDVKTNYVGSGVVSLDAEIIGVSGVSSNVGATAQRLSNGWVWGRQ